MRVLSSETAIEMVEKLIGTKTIILVRYMSTFMEMKKRVSKMTTFSLTIYHPLLREQILLVIMNALGK